MRILGDKRLDVGAHAFSSGIKRRKVLDKSLFLEYNIFNDDLADFKTKNHKFPAEARLQENFWLSYASQTSLNTGGMESARRRKTG